MNKMYTASAYALLLWITAPVSLQVEGETIFASKESSDYDFVHRHDIVVPHRLENKRRRRDLSTRETEVGHTKKATFVVPVFGDEYILDVELNRVEDNAKRDGEDDHHSNRSLQEVFSTVEGSVGYKCVHAQGAYFEGDKNPNPVRGLISNNFVEVYDDADGKRVQQKVRPEHCYYHGKVRGQELSSVVFSTCKGLSGMFSVNDETIHIKPHDKKHGINGDTHFHVVYKESDVKNKEIRTCGHNGSKHFEHKTHWPTSAAGNKILSRKIRSVPTFNQNLPTRYVEVYIVNDYRTYQNNPVLLTIRDRTIQIANTMDEFYKTLNIRVVLTGVENWSASDKMTVSTDESVTLKNFCAYKNTHISKDTIDYDVAQLVTGIDLTGSVAGLGYVGTMCGQLSCGINEDSTNTVDVAKVMAHEMGHNFGMNHDDGRTCGTCGWSGGCIMSSVVKSDPKAFTQCSVDDMKENKMGCLNDEPTSSYTDPVCGNGIKETGEECDCGSSSDCPTKDPCCEVTGCKLKSSSQCGEGDCCNNCQLKSRGTVCRAASSECDIEDTCTGFSNTCPEDKFKTDGTPCDTNTAYCHTGTCQSRLAQCKYLLGTSATVGVDWCYETVNAYGTTYGHCGKQSDGSYIKCQTQHAKCGKLQCGHPDSGVVLPVVGTSKSGSVVSSTSTVNGVTTTYNCKAGSADFGADVPDPGMVATGTKCGNGMWCQNTQCVSFTPTACGQSGGVECGGQGSCDYNGKCVCSGNYDPGTNCGTTIDTSTLLDCYSCSDDGKCGLTPNSTNANQQKCQSNSQICAVVNLERGQGAKPFYFRGCMYKSDCVAECKTTTQGDKQCTTCCTTNLCNTGDGNPLTETTTPGGDAGYTCAHIVISLLLPVFSLYVLC